MLNTHLLQAATNTPVQYKAVNDAAHSKVRMLSTHLLEAATWTPVQYKLYVGAIWSH